ncbi:MAG: hypothetical protein RL701_4681 [Pseudomonadota bacterium]|jgi:hypothetical protein
MPQDERPLSDWEELLAAERHIQQVVPGSVLVGGTAAALDGVLTGIRQQRRSQPLETEWIQGLRVPTLAEMARIKAWLLVTRDTTRDYLDCVVLLDRLGESAARSALATLDALYPQQNGASVQVELIERLAAAKPSDQARVDLGTYRKLTAPWNDWEYLRRQGRLWASRLAAWTLESSP